MESWLFLFIFTMTSDVQRCRKIDKKTREYFQWTQFSQRISEHVG